MFERAEDAEPKEREPRDCREDCERENLLDLLDLFVREEFREECLDADRDFAEFLCFELLDLSLPCFSYLPCLLCFSV